jgi:hypothetical protein
MGLVQFDQICDTWQRIGLLLKICQLLSGDREFLSLCSRYLIQHVFVRRSGVRRGMYPIDDWNMRIGTRCCNLKQCNGAVWRSPWLAKGLLHKDLR